MKKNTKKTAVKVDKNLLAFPATHDSYNEYRQYLNRASVQKRKITLAFNQDVQKYLTKGKKWDIIIKPGNTRWEDGVMRTKYENDTWNWYNATIHKIYLSDVTFDKKGNPRMQVVIYAEGDNVVYEYFNGELDSLQIYPAYTSPEGKEWKEGYGPGFGKPNPSSRKS